MAKTVYEFPSDKNQQLIDGRQISYEEVIAALDNEQVLDVIDHPNQVKYPHQQMFVVQVNDYVYLVPFVQKDKYTVFLKTIFPSRKARKQYLKVEASYED